ncbi:hypothetical protein [Methanosarcina acetivorans]|uniref:hypothetical protein n=1 Tax=Methanosarcina acetivorans TaxID=2214 RepID=UPI00064F11A6|nr:hypothetical protein [Methanosarcina acetivorans]
MKSALVNVFSMRKPQADKNKHELKIFVFTCFYSWFIEDIWNRCTSIRNNVFSSKNAISKNIMRKTSYLPKAGSKQLLLTFAGLLHFQASAFIYFSLNLSAFW